MPVHSSFNVFFQIIPFQPTQTVILTSLNFSTTLLLRRFCIHFLGMSQESTINDLTRFVCECKLINNKDEMEQVNEVEQVDETGHIDTTGGMIYFHEILDQFQIDKGIVHLPRNHKKSILEIQTKEMRDDDVIENNKKEKKNQPVSSNSETKETEAAMFTTAPRTILFPKFCELIVRLILKKYPSGKLILTETEIKKRKDSLKGKRWVFEKVFLFRSQ